MLIGVFVVFYCLFFASYFFMKCKNPKMYEIVKFATWLLGIASLILFISLIYLGLMTLEIFILIICSGCLVFFEILNYFNGF